MLKKGRKVPHLLKHRIPIMNIAELAGVTYNAATCASSRNFFNSKDLQSVIEYIIQTRKKKGLPELGQNDG